MYRKCRYHWRTHTRRQRLRAVFGLGRPQERQLLGACREDPSVRIVALLLLIGLLGGGFEIKEAIKVPRVDAVTRVTRAVRWSMRGDV